MKRTVLIAMAVLMVVSLAVDADAYSPRAKRLLRGTKIQGLLYGVALPGNGEPPVAYLLNFETTPMEVRMVVAFDGKEMWSSADVDSGDASMKLVEPAGNYSYVQTRSVELPYDLQAFDGDDVTIHAWTYESGKVGVHQSKVVTFDLPGEIKHAIVRSNRSATNLAPIYAEYQAHGATDIQYGTGAEADIHFAWAQLDEVDWDGVDNRNSSQALLSSLDDRYLMEPNGAEDRRWLVYLPFEEIIPAGSTVLDARWNNNNFGSMYQSRGDTLMAVLMGNAGDGLWHAASNDGAWHGEQQCHWTTWKNQIQGSDDYIDTGNRDDMIAYGAPTTSVPWSPAIESRTCYYDWGRWLQATSEPHATFGFDGQSAARFLDGDWYAWKLNRLVQKVVDGETNNGILLTWVKAGATQSTFSPQHPGSAASTELPFFTISWIEGVPYQPFMPLAADGKEADGIVTFTTDDGIFAANEAWIPEFTSRGLGYSIFMQGEWIGYGEDFYADAADLMNWRLDGMEVSTHGIIGYEMTSYDTLGTALAHWTPDMAIGYGLPEQYGGFDQMLMDMNPYWLFDPDYVNEWGEGPIFGPGFASDPYVGKTYSVNLGYTAHATLLSAKRNGYLQVRRIGMSHVNVRENTFPLGDWYDYCALTSQPALPGGYTFDPPGTPIAATPADTCYATFPPHNPRKIFNYMAYLNTCITNDLVGGDTDTPSQATVVQAFRNRMTGMAANNIRLVSFYTHDNKIPAGQFTEGMTATEMGWILDEALARNQAVLRLADFGRWRVSKIIPMDAPAGWTFDEWPGRKDGGIYGRLSWVDACKLSGVRRQGS